MYDSKPKRGRPPTARGAYNPHRSRHIGRVPDEIWAEIRAGQLRTGETLTEWATRLLLDEVRRACKKGNK